MAHDAAGDRAEAGGDVILGAPAVEFRGHLVIPGRAIGAARDDVHVVETEREQHGLFQPLIDVQASGPELPRLLRHARLAGVEQMERRFDGLADVAGGLRA